MLHIIYVYKKNYVLDTEKYHSGLGNVLGFNNRLG